MTHLPPLIIDLAVILAAAAASTILFSRLRQPIVLGYLVAGFLVGPHFKLWPTVTDTEGVKLWAEIGVIFLLFGLGLEFSFKKLAKVGKSAFIAAIFEIITMTGAGYLFGRALGWSQMDSIFLGTILSMSSTTIIVRAFSEAGLVGKAFVGLVFGILIVEDLMAILLMVILSALSIPGTFSGANLAFLSARLGFFLLLWFVGGIYAVPSLLKRVRAYLSNEIMLVFSIGLCFLMVVIASKAGFSAALGAFIMGSILAETEEGERIEHLLSSVKDLFAAVFFVSVGMMIDPWVLRDNFGVIVLITLLTIFGKLLGSGFGAVLSGRSLKHSVQAGMSLAQIGEFSFIIATLGVSLKVTSDFLYPIVVAVSAVTTFTTPYMIKFSGPMYDAIERRLPRRLLERLSEYERAMSTKSKEGSLQLIWRTFGLQALLNSVVVIAIGLAVAKFALPALINVFGNLSIVRFMTCVAALIACSPFIFAIALKTPKKLSNEAPETLLLLRRLQPGILLMRFMLGFVLLGVVISQFATQRFIPIALLVVSFFVLLVSRRLIEPLYNAVEARFLRNLNAKEIATMEELANLPRLAPWNATLAQVNVSSDSQIAGLTLEESKFRTLTGASVVMIDRGKRRIFAPTRSERILPNDELFLVGTEEQLNNAREFLKPMSIPLFVEHDELFNLESFVLIEGSPLGGRTIREINTPEPYGLIVGIERGTERILNPESNAVLCPNDVVWIFGRRDKIKSLTSAPAVSNS